MRFAATQGAHSLQIFTSVKEEIDYGGKLLLSKDYSLTRICFETSIQNLTNLYKFFKHFTRQPPRGNCRTFVRKENFFRGAPSPVRTGPGS
jgi:hypothetical protein